MFRNIPYPVSTVDDTITVQTDVTTFLVNFSVRLWYLRQYCATFGIFTERNSRGQVAPRNGLLRKIEVMNLNILVPRSHSPRMA